MRSFSKLAAYSVIGAMSAFIAGSAAASTWMYNGSKVSFEENGSKRRIVFSEPKAGLDKAGIKRGTVLFEGETKKNGRLSGYAKLFKAGCDPLDYFVEGSVDATKGEIVLQGQVPLFSNEGCKIKGYSEDAAASTLSFTSLSGGSGNYASRGTEQGDGNYDRGTQGTQGDQRYGQGADSRGTASNDPRDGYANNGSGNYDSRQGNGQSSGGYDNRQDSGNSGGQYGNSQYDRREDDPRYSSRGDQYDPRDDQGYDRDPRYADRRPSSNEPDYYDPRYDRNDPRDATDDYEERSTYRYRYYRRSQ